MLALSKRQMEAVEKVFPASIQSAASDLLSLKCGNSMPFCESHTSEEMDRIRLAAIKVSKGDIKKLNQAIDIAHTDWRYLLMSAGAGAPIFKRGVRHVLSGRA